jgi:hypothetical protein
MFLKKTALAIVIAGMLATASAAFSQDVNSGATNSSGALASQRGLPGRLPRALSGIWVPILTSSLAGFAYVRSRQRIS